MRRETRLREIEASAANLAPSDLGLDARRFAVTKFFALAA